MQIVKAERVGNLVKSITDGSPAERKVALRQLESEAEQVCDETLNIVLPILQATDSLERHRVAKIVRRLLFKLGPQVSPYGHRIMRAIQPMLMDKTYLTRQQGRELLASLTIAVGTPQILALIRSDLDEPDEHLQQATAATLAALAPVDMEHILPFVCAACQSHHATVRATALRAISNICIIIPGAVLANLPQLVRVVRPAIRDSVPSCVYQSCRTVSYLASACSPFGIETLEACIPTLWAGARTHRGRTLAVFIRALASLIPLMDPDSASEYAHSVLKLSQTHFKSPDDELKKAVLFSISMAEPADLGFLKSLVPSFFANFWNKRLALDRQAVVLILDATKVLARADEVLKYIVETNGLKDSSPPFRKLAMDALCALMTPLSIIKTTDRTQEQICDGLVTALRRSQVTDRLLIATFHSYFTSMGKLLVPYLEPLSTTILDCLNDPLVAQRELAALLVVPLAPAIRICGNTAMLRTLGTILSEQLGEESPEVLTAVLQGLAAICRVLGLSQMQPPVSDLLPRLTPILHNKDDNITQACIGLIGEIARRGPEYANAREWLRIANELIEIFKAPRKSVRRMANATFGHIARGIGPQDVLTSLLTTLKLERQSRVNSAVAMAIIADTCEPYTVLPALLNEYRTQDINVQHGVLKALSFIFEYTQTSQYLYTVTSLVDHALTSKNQVSRQTGASIVKHLALKSVGCGQEDVLVHFLNELWPHIFETSPHVIDRIMEAVHAVEVGIGAGALVPYLWAGLFHSARKTREVYWQIYNNVYVQSSYCMPSHYPIEVPALDVWF